MGHRARARAGVANVIGQCLAMLFVAAMATATRADEIAEAKLAQRTCERIVEPRTRAPFDTTEIQCYFAGSGCAGWSGVAPDGQQGERCAVRVYVRGGRVATVRRLYLSHDGESYQLDDHCYRPDGSLAVLRSEGETADGERTDATVWYDAHGQDIATTGGGAEPAGADAPEQPNMTPAPYLWASQIDAEVARLDPGPGAAGGSRVPDASGFSSIEAKRAVENRAGEVLTFLKRRNFHALAALVHPTQGLRLSSRGRVDVSADRVVMRSSVRELGLGTFMHEATTGEGDTAGIAVEWDFDIYYEHYVYDRDYAFAPQVSYNCPIGDAGAVDTVSGVYDDAIVVEHRFPASAERGAPAGASALNLVFKRHEGEWYIVGIVHAGSARQ